MNDIGPKTLSRGIPQFINNSSLVILFIPIIIPTFLQIAPEPIYI